MFYIMNSVREGNILEDILSLKDDQKGAKEAIGRLASFAIRNGLTGNIWKKYIIYTLIYNENPYSLSVEMGLKTTGDSNLVSMDFEQYFEYYTLSLDVLNEVSLFSFRRLQDYYLADKIDEIYDAIEKNVCYTNFRDVIDAFYKTRGVADMAIYKAFRVDDGILKPIKNVLSVSFSDIIGYDFQKKALRDNTEAFLAGRAYNNVLLYGDAGTGKSTSIKALLNTYFDQGLRIIEVYKHQMQEISKIIHTLKTRPYHYIIYMDDLSFEENEVEYKYLKSIIEGGIEPKPENVAIYATSNRRHLIKETTSDNGGVFDDLHRNETQAEKLSLAYRFGLQIYYSSLSPDEFRSMVKQMAKNAGITMDENRLVTLASAWQMRNGTLSGRCAEQFIRSLAKDTE